MLQGCGSFMLVSAKCSTLTCSMLLTLSSAVEQPTAVNTKEFQLETHQMLNASSETESVQIK